MSAFIHFDLISIHKRGGEQRRNILFWNQLLIFLQQAYSETAYGHNVFFPQGSHEVAFHLIFEFSGRHLKGFFSSLVQKKIFMQMWLKGKFFLPCLHKKWKLNPFHYSLQTRLARGPIAHCVRCLFLAWSYFFSSDRSTFHICANCVLCCLTSSIVTTDVLSSL